MLRTTTFRRIAIAPRVMNASVIRFKSSEGATGSGFSRPGGVAAGDTFTKREKAAEDLYVHQQETKKLKELKQKLQQQRKHLDDLDEHLDELTREQGGEKN